MALTSNMLFTIPHGPHLVFTMQIMTEGSTAIFSYSVI